MTKDSKKKVVEKTTKKPSKEDGKKKRLKNLKPFKKGKTGNSSGRPVGSKNLGKRLEECGAALVFGIDPVTKKKVKKTCDEWVCIKLYGRAMKGIVPAIKLIFERREGKVAENVNVKINDSARMEFFKAKMYKLKDDEEENDE